MSDEPLPTRNCCECGSRLDPTPVGAVAAWCQRCVTGGIDRDTHPGSTPVACMALRVAQFLRGPITAALGQLVADRAALYGPDEMGQLEVHAAHCGGGNGNVGTTDVQLTLILRLR